MTTIETSIATCKTIDDQLSQRPLELDPGGYFIIFLDRERKYIITHHFTNTINNQGLAVDPDTGKVIPAKGKVERTPARIYEGHTAKQLCVLLFEEPNCPVTQHNHAAYLGREFQRAEWALLNQQEYIQD